MLSLISLLGMFSLFSVTHAFDCMAVLKDPEITYLDWPNLQQCLSVVNSGGASLATAGGANITANVWRLMKIAHMGIEYIPADAYQQLGIVLVAIPLQDLHNISMDRVEVVEAFGSLHSMSDQAGFSGEQLAVIAQKVAVEWLGKTAKTYSEYDLMSLGEIVCHLNVSVIRELQVDAFKYAAESIGKIRNCPGEHLKAFAELAVREEAFGPLKQWSKLEVSIIGNIINGFTAADIATSIDRDKLHLNHFYEEQTKLQDSKDMRTTNAQGNFTLSNSTTTTSQNDLQLISDNN